MTDGNVTRVFSPDEALAFVIERGVIRMPIAELAAAWGWPHCTQVYRVLDRWVRDGLIERQGKVIRAHPSPPVQSAVEPTWIAERRVVMIAHAEDLAAPHRDSGKGVS